VRRLQEQVDRALTLASGFSQELRGIVAAIEDPLRLAYLLGSLLDMPADDKQKLLEADTLLSKLGMVSQALAREIALLEVKGKIESQAQQEMSDAQRQYYLRQQLKAIQDELGEGEGDEIQALRSRIEKANMPEAVLTVANREVDRLARMTPASPEYQMLRTYMDWLLDVPWSVTTDDRLDPVEARRVLDEDHYDLDTVKERIVEYLAVRKLKGDMKGPILCFVGPPGVGKTSLGHSIARAMNRKFVRISLGGIRDEAEIRGHRRTYIGSMPGRVVQALRQAGTRCSCSTRWTRYRSGSRAIRRPRCSKCSTPPRTTASAIITSRCLSTSRARCSSRRRISSARCTPHCSIGWRSSSSRVTARKRSCTSRGGISFRVR
jgi:ATP-dependent Lon protease